MAPLVPGGVAASVYCQNCQVCHGDVVLVGRSVCGSGLHRPFRSPERPGLRDGGVDEIDRHRMAAIKHRHKFQSDRSALGDDIVAPFVDPLRERGHGETIFAGVVRDAADIDIFDIEHRLQICAAGFDVGADFTPEIISFGVGAVGAGDVGMQIPAREVVCANQHAGGLGVGFVGDELVVVITGAFGRLGPGEGVAGGFDARPIDRVVPVGNIDAEHAAEHRSLFERLKERTISRCVHPGCDHNRSISPTGSFHSSKIKRKQGRDAGESGGMARVMRRVYNARRSGIQRRSCW